MRVDRLRVFNRVPFSVLVGITVMIGIVMLYFGIRLKGYRPENQVVWLPSGKGVQFRDNSIAYTEDFFASSSGGGNSVQGLSIELVVRFEAVDGSTFRYLLCVNGGDDARQLLVGQWRRWLVVMNGDDYDGKRGVPKISVQIDQAKAAPSMLAITSGAGGTSVYINGSLVKLNKDLHLYYPRGTGPPRLVVGNSMHDNHPWHGVISAMALYNSVLNETAIESHYRRWKAGDGFNVDLSSGRRNLPKICYVFERGKSERVVPNQAGEAFALQIPVLTTILEKQFLHWPRVRAGMEWNLALDMLINLIGFMPLGFMLVIVFSRLGGFAGRHKRLLAVVLAFGFSLSLEIVQAWIPSRDSSMLDLILNTLGAGLGGMVGYGVKACYVGTLAFKANSS